MSRSWSIFCASSQRWLKPFSWTIDLLGRKAEDVTFQDIVDTQGIFLDTVRKKLGIPGIPDYYFLLADLMGKEPGDILQRVVSAMMSRDYDALRSTTIPC